MAMASSTTLQDDLFSSVISEIKSYSGKDPLLPWLRGIKKMRESLPPQLLKEKLPRFLQKCVLTFETDKRYKNDLRYLRVWIQLMDYVDDPKLLLKSMEANHIGMKRSLFYQAYALYHEKRRKFGEADKMYRLGVQNLAEPMHELQKSYEQFLHRMERYRSKKTQRQEEKNDRRSLSSQSIPIHRGTFAQNNEHLCTDNVGPSHTWHKGSSQMLSDAEILEKVGISSQSLKPLMEAKSTRVLADCFDGKFSGDPLKAIGLAVNSEPSDSSQKQRNIENEGDKPQKFCSDDTIVVKFVDTAIVGKPAAEDACHHGLVDPTINLKEAMNAINSMFREPLDSVHVGRRSQRRKEVDNNNLKNGFQVFSDENLDNRTESLNPNEERPSLPQQSGFQVHHEPLNIFVDDEGSYETRDAKNKKYSLDQSMVGSHSRGSIQSAFVFPSPMDLESESSDNLDAESFPQSKLREDTVVCKFVGSAILDEPKVENVCHHGLVDPTINLKEAMDDINNMFGKPIDFVRPRRSKGQEKEKAIDKAQESVSFSILPDDDLQHEDPAMQKLSGKENGSSREQDGRKDIGGFSILPDEDMAHQDQSLPKLSSKLNGCDLFEPTVCTKDVMDEINKMFGMPLDF